MLRNIQVLRAFAALAVVWRHTLMWIDSDPGYGLLWVGRIGVDVFFVISGFIMFHTTRDGSRTTPAFWLDRLVRIGPPYWLATMLVLVLFGIGLPAGNLASVSAKDVVLDLAFIPHVRADGDGNPVLTVGWTLIYEAYFYALFGLTLRLRSQLRALMVLTVIFVGGFLMARHRGLPFTIVRYTQPITLEFLAGGALALLYNGSLRVPARLAKVSGVVLIVLGTAVPFVLSAIFRDATAEPTALRTALFGPPAVLIVAGALLLERVGVAAQSPLLLFLGAASYSIYLIHPFVAQYMGLAIKALVVTAPLAKLAGFGLSLLLSAVAGSAFYVWLERPMLNALRVLTRRNRVERASRLAA